MKNPYKQRLLAVFYITFTCNHFYLNTGEKASTHGLRWPLETPEATEKTPVLLTFSQSTKTSNTLTKF